MYRDIADSFKAGTEKASFSLQDFYGIQSGFSLDKEHHVLALICLRHVTLLAFDNYESLNVWRIIIREHLGQGECMVYERGRVDRECYLCFKICFLFRLRVSC